MIKEELIAKDFRRIYHRHIAELLGPFLASFGMLIAGLLVPVIISFLRLTLSSYSIGWLWLFGGLYLVGVTSYFFLEWLLWYLDFWILTDRRLIDIQLTALFRRRVAELPLVQVQDIAVDQSGFLQNVLGYGNVRVQSAAKEGFFVIRAVSHPQEVRSQILELAAQGREIDRRGGEKPQNTSAVSSVLVEQSGSVPSPLTIDKTLLHLIDPLRARAFRVIPLRKEEDKLILASDKPRDAEGLQQLALLCGLPVEITLVSSDELNSALERYYPIS